MSVTCSSEQYINRSTTSSCGILKLTDVRLPSCSSYPKLKPPNLDFRPREEGKQ